MDLNKWADDNLIAKNEMISQAFGELMDWFRKDYPNGHIRLDTNMDWTVGRTFWTLVVMTEEEATPMNRGMMKKTWSFGRDEYEHLTHIYKFCEGLKTHTRAYITMAMNKHFQEERDRVGKVTV